MKPLTPDVRKRFENATICHICEKPLALTDFKDRDHCHFTNTCRGAAHERCNFNYTKSQSIP